MDTPPLIEELAQLIGVNVLDVDPDKVVTDARAVSDTVPNLTTLSENADSTMGRATYGYEGRSATALAENWQRNGGGLHRGTRRKGGQPTRRPRQPRAGRAGRPVEPVRERDRLTHEYKLGQEGQHRQISRQRARQHSRDDGKREAEGEKDLEDSVKAREEEEAWLGFSDAGHQERMRREREALEKLKDDLNDW
ncbi:hypothetical protein ACGFNP_10225 [Nonomuraea sp. NPDC049269]|uniref:hypothetical protein n=1 Tax=Nonomuraea sp. NPDC049269 TaxID=3364349 RepID=UPI00371393BE